LAERGLVHHHTEPRVGCILVKDGQVVGEGWHARAGESMPEVHACGAAGERARGATAYVNLERAAITAAPRLRQRPDRRRLAPRGGLRCATPIRKFPAAA